MKGSLSEINTNGKLCFKIIDKSLYSKENLKNKILKKLKNISENNLTHKDTNIESELDEYNNDSSELNDIEEENFNKLVNEKKLKINENNIIKKK